MTKKFCLKAFINENIKNSYKFIKMEKEEDKGDYYFFCLWILYPFFVSVKLYYISLNLFFLGLENKRHEIIDKIDMKDNLNNIFIYVIGLYIILMVIPYTIFFYSIYLIILILFFIRFSFSWNIVLGFYSSVSESESNIY